VAIGLSAILNDVLIVRVIRIGRRRDVYRLGLTDELAEVRMLLARNAGGHKVLPYRHAEQVSLRMARPRRRHQPLGP
jgi:hypothetical protein